MMLTKRVASLVEQIPGLSDTGLKLSRSIHEAVMKGGKPARKLADLLHGTWLGHPLHPVLTDVAIGAWAFAGVFDVIASVKGDRYAERAADFLTTAGTVAAVPTALAGLADYSVIRKPAVTTATLHALLNDVNVVLYLLSIQDRKRGNRERALFFSSVALGLMAASAWLGGHLVYQQRVGVDHSDDFEGPEGWTPVLEDKNLPEAEAKRVDVDGKGILLYRCDGRILAIGSVCSHAGGPLEEGDIQDCRVTCPWHDSVFDLRDGSIVHGPATRPQARFDTRVRDGRIEIRYVSF